MGVKFARKHTPAFAPGQSRLQRGRSGPGGRTGRTQGALRTPQTGPLPAGPLPWGRGKDRSDPQPGGPPHPTGTGLWLGRHPEEGAPGEGASRACGAPGTPDVIPARVYSGPAPIPGPRLPPPPPWPPPRLRGRGRSRARSSRRPSPSSCSSGSECELGAAAPGSALSARAALNPLRARDADALPPPLAAAPAALTRCALGRHRRRRVPPGAAQSPG